MIRGLLLGVTLLAAMPASAGWRVWCQTWDHRERYPRFEATATRAACEERLAYEERIGWAGCIQQQSKPDCETVMRAACHCEPEEGT